MKRINIKAKIITLPVGFVLLFILFTGCNRNAPERWTAIRGTTIVDVTNGELLSDRTVLIADNVIARIGATADVDIPEDAVVVEGAGTYLIPGLWDMHAHALSTYREVEPFFKTLIANGVTGIRDPQNSSRKLEAMVEPATAGGLMPGPVRIVVAGNLVDGAPPIWPGSQVADNPARGRAIVDSLTEADAPFIKIYNRLSPETYFAIADRAREVGIPFMGHVPLMVSAADASDAGHRSIEHFTGVMLGCTAAEESALQALNAWADAFADGDTTISMRQAFGRRRAAMRAAPFDEVRCRDLLARFAENETWQVPTLVTAWGLAFGSDAIAANDPSTAYVPPVVMGYWKTIAGRVPPFAERQFRRQQRIAGLLEELDVPLLVGTDMPGIPMMVPGFSIHHEMELLVETGLSPLYVLQAATLNPARFFGMTDSLGTVEEGKLADLVLLEANPLEDISNTRRIRAVIANGRLYDRDRIDALLEEVAATSARRSLTALLQETFDSDGFEAVRMQYLALRKATPDSVNFSEWELIELAHSLLDEGRADEANAVFEWTIESYPDSPYAYGAYADALLRIGKEQKAQDLFVRAAEVAKQTEHPTLEYFQSRERKLQ